MRTIPRQELPTKDELLRTPDETLENDAWCAWCLRAGERVPVFALQDDLPLCREHYTHIMFAPENERRKNADVASAYPGGRQRASSAQVLAAIDIGTNTVRLLVVEVQADGGWQVVDQARRLTRLGEGAEARGALQPPAVQRTIGALEDFAERARRAGADCLRAVATSAVREAANQAKFLDTAWQQARVAVQVIDSAEEARLTVAGVQRAVGRLEEVSLVVDIGGGSTEFTLTQGGEILATMSRRLGVVSLTERYLRQAPTQAQEYASLVAEIDAELAAVERELEPRRATQLLGTAGTITTLVALDLELERYDAETITAASLSLARVRRLVGRLKSLSLPERRAIPALEEGREDLIVSGAALVVRMMEQFGFSRLRVSDYGLREGLICAMLSSSP